MPHIIYFSSKEVKHSLNDGFLKWGYPQIILFNRIFHYKASILGYPHVWKPRNGPKYVLIPRCAPNIPLLGTFNHCNQRFLSCEEPETLRLCRGTMGTMLRNGLKTDRKIPKNQKLIFWLLVWYLIVGMCYIYIHINISMYIYIYTYISVCVICIVSQTVSFANYLGDI